VPPEQLARWPAEEVGTIVTETKANPPTDSKSVRELFRLDGKVALVTGGYGGLASAAAHALAEQGCAVVLAARRSERCAGLVEELAECHAVTSFALSADVSKEEDVARLISTAVERLGGLDVVVNSAATFWAAPAEQVPADRGWRRVLDVNLTGTFLVCQEAARAMLDGRGGSLINMASSGAFMSFMPEAGSTLSYTTSKGAIVNLTRDLAAQWSARGVRVNAVAPGSMASGMTESIPAERQQLMIDRIPMRRLGRPDELKGAIAYLASPASSYVTGAVLVVDGGQTIV
jgi:gluconate 5-dehydrogenase